MLGAGWYLGQKLRSDDYAAIRTPRQCSIMTCSQIEGWTREPSSAAIYTSRCDIICCEIDAYLRLVGAAGDLYIIKGSPLGFKLPVIAQCQESQGVDREYLGLAGNTTD